MSIPIWPLSLPQVPLMDSYKETIPSNLLRSETDSGPAKVRRRGHSKPYTVEAKYILSTEQMQALTNFCETTLGGGAKCFNWPRPRFTKNSYIRARFSAGNDGLLSYSLVPDTTDFWTVTIKLEVFPNVPVN